MTSKRIIFFVAALVAAGCMFITQQLSDASADIAVNERAGDIPPTDSTSPLGLIDINMGRGPDRSSPSSYCLPNQPPVGSVLLYDVTQVNELVLRAGGSTAGSDRSQVSARLRLQVAARDEASQTLVVSCDSVHQGDASDSKRQTPVAVDGKLFARLTLEGNLMAIGMQGGSAGYSDCLLRSLADGIWWTVSSTPSSSWAIQEVDTLGSYDATYNLVEDSPDTISIVREKHGYRYHKSVHGGSTPARSIGHASFSRRNGGLVAADVHESHSFVISDLEIAADLERHMQLAFVSITMAPVPSEVHDTLGPESLQSIACDVTMQYGDKSRRQAMAAAVADTNLAAHLALVLALLKDPNRDDTAIARAFDILLWMMRLDDKSISVIDSLIQARSLDPVVECFCIDAIGASDTPQAQQVLASLLRDSRLPTESRDHATVSMLQLSKPSPSLMAELESIMRSDAAINANALLVYGGLAGRLEASGSGEESRIAELINMEPECPKLRVPSWLLALGNTRSPVVLPRVLEHVSNQDPDARRAAFTALSKIPNQDAISALMQSGPKDPDWSVRMDVAHALAATGDPSCASRLSTMALTDAEPEVRKAALRALGRVNGVDAHSVWRSVASQDADASVRKFATRLLSDNG